LKLKSTPNKSNSKNYLEYIGVPMLEVATGAVHKHKRFPYKDYTHCILKYKSMATLQLPDLRKIETE
jgi:hypothetical protein